jgi:hypothetical protein
MLLTAWYARPCGGGGGGGGGVVVVALGAQKRAQKYDWPP